MDLKDIPDRWKRFNPETPPYKYFPNRTRKQTAMYSWIAMAVCTGAGYLLLQLVERHNEGQEEMYAEYAKQNMSYGQAQAIKDQTDVLREIMMKARRQRLGLPANKHGSVEIQDPFDDE
mmetsp:Transcript_30546/g.71326  ORF Transcript_30546/g.71326 Transcript_30546/m.71326 type:complete len:119 (+) Transcript_30546:111-467(+)|eukprot:CAMPEP_0178421406 /NCGR_PEP_ID=MMETSP0689_2-20121128/26630_1 /TAXON_ID=160604 /ORGANISM="Amphidinium massartii, Strain CS-259" /LENGTH=118 /DNA_ID=CAMNT_0020042915 /DNA_START=34 /DNA_END=390 /DNA_ORIENTATION=-